MQIGDCQERRKKISTIFEDNSWKICSMLRTIQSRYIFLRLQSYLPISYSRQFVSKIQYYILQISLRPRIIKQNDLAFHRFHIPSIQVFMSDSFLYEGTFFIWYMKDFIVLLKPYYLKYFRGWCTYRYFF